jgi:phage virion morphogenesis protein
MLQLKLSVKGLDTLQSSVNRLERATHDLQPAMQAVGEYVLAGIKAGFSAETTPDGQGWLALKPGTVANREALGYPGAHPILRRTGTLEKSIAIFAAPRSVTVGSALPYAGFHQTGYRNGSKGVPARPLVGLASQGLEGATRVLMAHINKAL